MLNRTLRLAISLAACGLLVLSGCALDPMERLSEEIDAQEVATKRSAVLELANLRDDRAIEALVEVLESDEHVYDMAGVALVKQGRETITDKKPDPVITMVAGIMNNVHQPQANRARAAWVLGEIGDREAIPGLRTGAGALTASGAAAAAVQDQATLALKKLGNNSEGAQFELPMGIFREGTADVLPDVESVAPPEEEEEEEELEGEEGAEAEEEEASQTA